MPEMRIENLNAGYEDMEILHDVNIDLQEGKISCLLGPNGAGKSTLLDSIMSLTEITGGHIFVGDDEITGKEPETIAKEHNVRLVREEQSFFPILTVDENLDMSLDAIKEDIDSEERKRKKEMIFDLFPRLEERTDQEAETLSGGERKMLSLSMGIIAEPDVLLIDEVSLGVMPVLVKEIYEALEEIQFGASVLVVDQEAHHPLGISDYVYILEEGKVALEGLPENIKEEEHVIDAYLGGL